MEKTATFDKEILSKIKKVISKDYLETSDLVLQVNAGDSPYNSINIKLQPTPYRSDYTGDNKAILFCRIKSGGNVKYISFYDKYKKAFENLGLKCSSIKSDVGFVRVDLDDFIDNLNKLDKLLNKIFISSVSFETFGCCSRYKKCSEERKCIHDDLLYSSACMYRKNLEMVGYSTKRGRYYIMAESTLERKEKGTSLITFPDKFIVLDIETTGLNSLFCEIIEVSALKVDSGNIVEKFSTLIKPDDEVEDFITELTGITNEMLKTAPKFQDIEKDLRNFLGNEIIVGHNVNFDINFLYDNLSKPLTNNFVDTMRISRKILPELPHHRLKDLSDYYKIDYSKAHRAEQDCLITFECLKRLKDDAIKKYGTLEEFIKPYKRHYYSNKVKASELSKDENSVVDKNNYLYEKICVFTGELKINREQAMQVVLNIGGKVADNITKKTNVLILGSSDSPKTKSSKQKKAEEYILKGQDLEIISEDMFYEIMGL